MREAEADALPLTELPGTHAIVVSRLANLYRQEHRYTEAQEILTKAIETVECNGVTSIAGLVYCYAVLGHVFEDVASHEQAHHAYSNAFNIALQLEGPTSAMTMLQAEVYLEHTCRYGTSRDIEWLKYKHGQLMLEAKIATEMAGGGRYPFSRLVTFEDIGKYDGRHRHPTGRCICRPRQEAGIDE